jgi:hypothetical protein
MIEAKNLRIGNFVAEILVDGISNCNRQVLDTEEDFPICKISGKDIYDLSRKRRPKSPYIDVTEIPITIEWVERFSFKWSKYYDWWSHKNPYILLNKDFSLKEEPYSTKIKPKYVHELQNIFYWLTGSELELK